MRILFVTTRPPWPSRRGDQARTSGWVRELGERHEIAVVAQRPPGFPRSAFPPSVRGRDVPLSRARILLSLLRAFRLPLQVAWHYQPRFAEIVRREIDDFRPDVAVAVLSRLGWLTPSLGGVPWVFDFVDSLALNMRRRAVRQPRLGPLWRWEADRIERWDRSLALRVARVTVVSSRDADAVAGGADLEGRVRVVPFGVRLPGVPPRRRAGASIVLLSGNLGYFPTVDGARWLANEVWPRVRSACPEARWWLAGSRPPRGVRRLGRLPGVRVLAEPEDLAAIRQQAAVAVAPMLSGSGAPIKILEAMAEGLPVVATPQAAAGLEGLGGGELTITGDPTAFAEALVRLLEDSEAARRQAASAWPWLRDRHDLKRLAGHFEDLLLEAASGR